MAPRITRRKFIGTSAAVSAVATLPWQAAAQGSGTLRVALSGPVIPRTTGMHSGGVEGRRMVAHSIYDPLLYWGPPEPNNPDPLAPMLATDWRADEADRTRWIFTLRRGVRFHDGSDFNADSVLWNLEKYFDETSPQFKEDEAGLVRAYVEPLAGWRKLNDHEVEIQTGQPDAFFPYKFAYLMFASPAQWEAMGRDWNRVANAPSGTGPFRLTSVSPQERAEFVRNDDYWDADRIPRVERMVLLPIPEANTRTSALLSGQVDWIEAVAPDTIPALEAGGAQVVTNPYPQVWGYWPSRAEGSPWNDIRVRKAANLAIDREGMTAVLNGMMIPAKGVFRPHHPWFGKPTFDVRYDPDEARSLLAEAGYSLDTPLRASVVTTPSGSGVMQPEPMNAFVQRNLAEVGIEVTFISMDWGALYTNTRQGANHETSGGATLTNMSWTAFNPQLDLRQLFHSKAAAPDGFNWGYINEPAFDDLLDRAQLSFDPDERDRLLAALHQNIVDEAAHIFVAHDPFPRAFGGNVSGFVEGYYGIRVQDQTKIRVG